MKKLFFLIVLINMAVVETSLAFTEITPRTLEQYINRAAQGNKQAKQQVLNLWLQQLSKIDTKKHTRNEALTRMQTLVTQGKIPSYILERGRYQYTEGNNAAYVVGEKVFMRLQPNTQARIIDRTNVNTTTYLTYLGEWKHPKTGENWFCVKNSSGEVGWIFGKYVKLVPNEKFKEIVSQINGKSAVSGNTTEITATDTAPTESTENDLSETLKQYSIHVLLIWVAAFCITFHVLDWKPDIKHILKFVFWSAVVAAGAIAVCLVAYYILWKKIILPLLKVAASIIGAIIVLFSLSDHCNNTNCPFYPKHNCIQCNTCREH